MSIHVAILQKPYLDAVLAGRKTIESRLTRQARPPFDAITPGERVFFKQSAGPFRATAICSRIQQFQDLLPANVETLRQKFQDRVGGDDVYWQSKAQSRYAVFLHLEQVEPLTVGPAYKVQQMRAWYVLEESLSPLREVTLTAGAIRNGYAMLPNASAKLRVTGLAVVLPDRRTIRTDFAAGARLRWRGWREVYRRTGVAPGDRLRWVALGGDRFAVHFPDADDLG
jgi:ASC-1-like (ASCH) protein